MTPGLRVMLLIDADNVASDAVSALRAGNQLPLNGAAKALRSGNLPGKNASALKLFEKHPLAFEVSEQPDRVRWIGAAGT